MSRYFNYKYDEFERLDSDDIAKMYAFYTLSLRDEDLIKAEFAYLRFTIVSLFADKHTKHNINDYHIDKLLNSQDDEDKEDVYVPKTQEEVNKINEMIRKAKLRTNNRLKEKRRKKIEEDKKMIAEKLKKDAS